MRIARILYPITSLGPGKRIVIWTAGCSKRCFACANPELWESETNQEIAIEKLAQILLEIHETEGAHAITFTGGDPLEQAEDLLDLLEILRPIFDDILVYTGFSISEISAKLQEQISESEVQKLSNMIDVLIDGPYIDKLNDNSCPLRGSTNQNIHYLAAKNKPNIKAEYERYLLQGRVVQNVSFGGKIISIGIHNRELRELRE